jgi:hypothetical protein
MVISIVKTELIPSNRRMNLLGSLVSTEELPGLGGMMG